MKEFFKTVRSSIWDPAFYATASSRALKEGVKYLGSLAILAAFIAVVVLSVRFVPVVLKNVGVVTNLIVTNYPTGLVMTFDRGAVTTSEAKAYFMKLPPEIFKQSELDKLKMMGVENFAVIDTRSDFESSDQWRSAQSLILLSRNAVVMEDKGGYKVQPLPRDLKLVVDKGVVSGWASQIMPIVRVVLPTLIIFGFVVFFIGNFVLYTIYALLAALIIWMIARLVKRPGRYGEFLTVAFHSVTLAVLVDLFLIIFGLPMAAAMSRAILITVVVWMVNVEIWKKPELPVANPPSPLPEIKQ